MSDGRLDELTIKEPDLMYGSAARIEKIKFSNYKFFYGAFELLINGKNLLVYGENGSGKSSIYKALGLLTEKRFTDFERNRNIFAQEGDVEVEFTFSNGQELIISADLEEMPDHVQFIKGLSVFKPMLDYKKLLKVHYEPQRSDEEINLYPMFSELLKDYPIDNDSRVLADIDDLLEYFAALKSILDDNFREAVNNFLENFFEADFSIDKFEYRTKRDKETNIAIPVVHITIDYKEHVIKRYHLFLNEARLSALAISLYFISIKKLLGGVKGENLKILVLDDLLISLDMGNRLKLLKILKREFYDFQIFFFTHDRDLYEVYKDKLDWKKYELYLDTHDEIPALILKESSSEIEKAKVFYAQQEYECAAVWLRKGFEKLLKRYLTTKEQRNTNCEELNLSGLTERAISKSDAKAKSILEKLNSDRKHILNPLSHDDSKPIYAEELRSAIADLEKLQELIE